MRVVRAESLLRNREVDSQEGVSRVIPDDELRDEDLVVARSKQLDCDMFRVTASDLEAASDSHSAT